MKKLIAVLLLISILFHYCKKDSSFTNSPPIFTPTQMTNIKGMVVDNNQMPISGVEVSIDESILVTSSKGLFAFNNIDVTSRVLINFKKEGYFETSQAITSVNNVSNYLKIVLDQKQLNSTFSSANGDNVNLSSGVGIDFPPNAYVSNDGSPYNGNVNVFVNTISTEDNDFTMRIPGGDLSATTTNGEDTRLYSYGMLNVVLTGDNGEEININDNTEISFPIPLDMIASAPNQIPLWYYNETTGIWEEEGSAIRNGNLYVGNVTHFSNWNFDIPGDWGGIEGRILDCEGSPLANVLVIVGQQSTSTNSNGEFDMFITPNQNHILQVITNYGDTISQSISAVSTNTVYDAGDITICAPVIEGTIIDCNGNPAQNVLVYSPYSPHSYTYSDINGYFSFFFAENISSTIYAEGFFGTISPPTSIPSLSYNQVYNAGSIIMCEGNTNITTVAEDKQNISNSFASMENCISNIKNGYTVTALSNFLDLNEGDILSENWVENLIENIDSLLNLNAISDNNMFDFNTNLGTYNWSHSNNIFIKSSVPNNKIIINFPSSENTPINDAVFTFHSYSDIALFYDGDNIYAPSDLFADLYVSGTKVFEINGNYTYDVTNPTPIPITINTVLTFNPFMVNITGSRITSTTFEASLSISDNSGCLTTISANVEFTHNDYENIGDDDVVAVNTTLTHDDLHIIGFMDGDLLTYDDPSSSIVNSMANVEAHYLGKKIGELIQQSNINNEEDIYIIYSDGTSEDVEVYYDPFLVNIEQIFFPFLGDWD